MMLVQPRLATGEIYSGNIVHIDAIHSLENFTTHRYLGTFTWPGMWFHWSWNYTYVKASYGGIDLAFPAQIKAIAMVTYFAAIVLHLYSPTHVWLCTVTYTCRISKILSTIFGEGTLF